MRSLPIAVLSIWFAWGCGSSPAAPSSTASPAPAPSPSPSPTPAPLPTPPAATLYRVTGVVRDEAGSPLAGLSIHLEYGRGSGYSNPESRCPGLFCYLTTTTDAAGRYEAVFDAVPRTMYGSSGVAGLVHTWREGYQPTVQLLPLGSSDIVQDLRLRRSRVISAGEQVTVSIEPDSSLCTDLEDWFRLGSRCDSVEIVPETTGLLIVDARESAAGRPVPLVFFQTSGNYTGGQNVGTGIVSVGVRARERYRVLIGVPSGLAPQRYELTTSVHVEP